MLNVNMDFNMKRIVKDAGAAFSRVVQLTEEKLGTSEKTELDAHFENLWDRSENTKNYTEKIVRNTEAFLIPNPGNRIEDYIYEKIEKKRPARLSNLEYLGLEMVEAGNTFGPGTAYGSSLIKVGQWEQKLGQTERDFIGSAGMCFTQPLRKFLETEMKTIIKEKNLLEMKRLDLDACKNRVRKARSMLGQPSTVNDPVVTDIRALRYLPDGKIYFKLNFDEDWTELPQRSKKITENVIWPQMYVEKRKIKKQKWQHLQQLKSVLPSDCHAFYDNIEYTNE